MMEPLLKPRPVSLRDLVWSRPPPELDLPDEPFRPLIGIGLGLSLGLLSWGLILLAWWLLAA